ncbi:MAG: AbrB/MazE/SpoVT family DNA-binding domain-containing protein [bacterium]
MTKTEFRNVTSKGQVTIPKKIRDILDIDPGDKIKFEIKNIDGDTLVTISKESTFSYLLGELQKEAKKQNIDKKEMDKIIEETREKLVEDLYPDV